MRTLRIASMALKTAAHSRLEVTGLVCVQRIIKVWVLWCDAIRYGPHAAMLCLILTTAICWSAMALKEEKETCNGMAILDKGGSTRTETQDIF